MITFDSVELPNASITNIEKTGGAYTWEFSCLTDDYSIIETLMDFAAPLQAEIDITGQQYVISAKSPATLAIDTTSYTKCYLQGPISADPQIITPARESYLFKVTVVQSAV